MQQVACRRALHQQGRGLSVVQFVRQVLRLVGKLITYFATRSPALNCNSLFTLVSFPANVAVLIVAASGIRAKPL